MRHFTDALFEDFDLSLNIEELQKIATKIKAETEAHEKDGPYGNQNCMLCTWAVELQLRGEDFLPRPVISDDDIIFEKGHYNFVKNGKKETFKSVDELLTLIENGARYYCHVNWADSEGGHEFLLVDDGDRTYIVDGQVGKVVPLAEDEEYFKDINFDNSYIVRVDNKDLNNEVLELNNINQMSKSALKEDTKYILDEDYDKGGLTIEGVENPEQLMDWMNENITYELVDDEYSNSNGIPTKTAEEVLETKTGHCAEQSYLEKEVLNELGYESFLVMVKENNSKKEYGAEGSAHVFLVYKDGDQFCWFEHSMQHSRGIHKYSSLEELLQDVANQWWRYDKNSDILEVRMMDKYITGVDNWGLAKECYKYPVEYTFDISDNNFESEVPEEFDPPYNEEQIKANYGDETYQRLIDDPAHAWRMKTGLELIHKEPEKTELKRIWGNWLLMTPEQKEESDKKSIELFGKTNAENFAELIKEYSELEESLSNITYKKVSDLDHYKKCAKEILGGFGDLSDKQILKNNREIYIDNKLVGYIGFDEYDDVEGYDKVIGFGNFMIIERGKGYGTQVIKDLIKTKKAEYDLIYCFVDADNSGAINLYKKLGIVYDEDGPNDNGQYYVTFWDKGEC